MFFVLSKVLWLVVAPTNLLLLGMCAGAALWAFGVRALGRALALGSGGTLLVCGFLPIGTLLLRPLEDRFPAARADGPAPTGIVVLGGPIDPFITADRGQVAILDAASRLTEAVVLARRFPGARLLYTGGSNALIETAGSEAESARRLWIGLGVDPDRITIEDRSRNTFENAQFSRALIGSQPGQYWLLVTSAYHMPRAMGLFRAAKVPVVPHPVDYRTTGTWRDFEPTKDASAGLARLDFVVREWIGLIAYRLTGKTDAVLPRP